MPLGEYLIGALFFAGTFGCSLGAAALLVRRRLPDLGGAAALLAHGTLSTTGVIATHLLPGLAGVLSRGSALACAVVLLAVTVVVTRDAAPPPAHDPSPRPSWGLSLAIAAVGVGALACWGLASAWVGTRLSSSEVDTLTFHLPNIAEWVQAGSVWRVDQYTPLLANGNYPQNGDVVFLSAVLPWHSVAFVRVVGLPFAALAGLAVYALAVEIGARRTTGALFGAVFLAVPVYSIAAYEGAKTDAPMLAMLGAGTYFLLRHLRDRRRSTLLLGGLALGIGFGTKWYGMWSVAIVVAVWVAAALVARRPPRRVLVQAAGMAGLIAVAGGVWMLRNAVISGSPVNPSPVRLVGLTLFDAPTDYVRDCGGFTLVDYVDDPGVWREFVLPAFRAGYAGPGLALALGWLLAAVLVVREVVRRAPRERWLVPAALVACVPLLAAAYALTPYSAIGLPGRPSPELNLRWLLPAMLLAAPASAWAVGRLPRAFRMALEALALLAVANGIHKGFDVPLRVVVLAGLAAAGLAGALVGVAVAWRRRGGVAGRTLAAGAIVGLVALSLAVGDRRQDSFAAASASRGDPVTDALARADGSGRRVGLAGVWSTEGLSPVLAAFGPRLENQVDFVGPTRGGQLREYATRAGFLAALRRGRYDTLVVGRGSAGYGGCDVPGSETDEDAWARGAGLRLVAQTGRLSLYSLRGASGASP